MLLSIFTGTGKSLQCLTSKYETADTSSNNLIISVRGVIAARMTTYLHTKCIFLKRY